MHRHRLKHWFRHTWRLFASIGFVACGSWLTFMAMDQAGFLNTYPDQQYMIGAVGLLCVLVGILMLNTLYQSRGSHR